MITDLQSLSNGHHVNNNGVVAGDESSTATCANGVMIKRVPRAEMNGGLVPRVPTQDANLAIENGINGIHHLRH